MSTWCCSSTSFTRTFPCSCWWLGFNFFHIALGDSHRHALAQSMFDSALSQARSQPESARVSCSAVVSRSQPQSAGVSRSAVVDRSQPESAGVSRSQPESAGVSRSQPKSAGVSRRQPESAGVSRSQPESAVVSRSQPESAVVRRSHMQSAGKFFHHPSRHPVHTHIYIYRDIVLDIMLHIICYNANCVELAIPRWHTLRLYLKVCSSFGTSTSGFIRESLQILRSQFRTSK